MYESSEVLTRLDIDEEDCHHQVETGSAKADSVDCRVAHQHLTVAPTMGLITHHVEERHLKHTPILIYHSVNIPGKDLRKKCVSMMKKCPIYPVSAFLLTLFCPVLSQQRPLVTESQNSNKKEPKVQSFFHVLKSFSFFLIISLKIIFLRCLTV